VLNNSTPKDTQQRGFLRDSQSQSHDFFHAGEVATPPAIIEENRWAIEDISGVKVAGVIKKISHFSHPPVIASTPLRIYSDIHKDIKTFY